MKFNSEIAIESAEIQLLLTEGLTDDALDKFKHAVHVTKGQMSVKIKEFKTTLRKYTTIPQELRNASQTRHKHHQPNFSKKL